MWENFAFGNVTTRDVQPPPALARAPATTSLKLGAKSDVRAAVRFAEPLIRELGMPVSTERLIELALTYTESESLAWFLLREQGEIVGIILVGLRQMWHDEEDAYIDGWLVRLSCRGTGKGTLLKRTAAAWARRKGARRLYLSVPVSSPFTDVLPKLEGWRPMQTTLLQEI